MQSLKRLPASKILRLSISRSLLNLLSKSSKPSFSLLLLRTPPIAISRRRTENEWNNTWESAWLPEDLTATKNRAHWEIDVNFSKETVILSPDVDPDTKAFIQHMDENWNQRRGAALKKLPMREEGEGRDIVERVVGGGEKESLESMKKDYRLKKQRIHAGLWMKEIEKEEEASLGNLSGGADIERLLNSCSE